MSSTIYSDFAIYSTGISDEVSASDEINLFDEGSEVVVVLAQRIDSNVDGDPKWNCDFIGTASQFFKEYVPRMATLFDDGSARSRQFKRGSQFSKAMFRMFYDADPVRLQDFYQKGVRGYSWDKDEYGQEMIGPEPIWYNYYSTTRAGFLLASDQDIEVMIRQALLVRSAANNHVWAGRPWLASTAIF